MSDDSLESLLVLARTDGCEPSQAKLLSRVAGASSLGLVLASTRAALALEMKLLLSGQLVSWGAGLTKAGIAGGVLGAAAGMATEDAGPTRPSTVSVQAEPVAASSTPPARIPTVVQTRATAAASPPRAPSEPIHGVAPPSRPEVTPVGAEVEGAAVLPTPDAADGLEPALAVLERTRGAIARGDGHGALAALAAYPRVRGDGTLDPEARLLGIVAKRFAGRGREATAEAEQWLRDEPKTPFADALRAVLEQKP